MSRYKIGPTGAWTGPGGHRCDPGLSQALAAFFIERGGTVLDAGCGDGAYVRALQAAGIDCEGVDGNPLTDELTGGLCGVLDLALPVNLGMTYDWVLSLEVGEHIPRVYEHNFIRNLHRLNRRGVVLSWALPGQGGHGHANERPLEHIRGLFEHMGYKSDFEAESILRASVTDYCRWLRDTLMVFVR